MRIVTLTADELEAAAHQGIKRRCSHFRRNAQERNGGERNTDNWGSDIESIAAEIAYAKATNKYHAALSWETRYNGDVDGKEIRHTPYANGHLLLHDDAHDDRRYILVTGREGTYAIHGWIWGRDGKDPKYLADPCGGRPAYWVPQSALNEIPDHAWSE